MTKPKDRDTGGNADLEDLARRFHDLWRDQLAAMADDPEFTEIMRRWFGTAAGGGQAVAGSASKSAAGSRTGGAGHFDPFNPTAWLAAFGGGAMGGAGQGKKQSDDSSAAKGTPPPATRAQAAAASSRTGDVAGNELEHRLADLERRLERLEAAIGGQGRGASPRARKRRS